MARKRNGSKKSPPKTEPRPSALPAPTPSRSSYMRRWRDQRALGVDADRWAKLELQLGRFSAVAGIASGFVLGFTVFVASILDLGLPVITGLKPTDLALWIPVVLVSFAISGYTVAKKIGPYRGRVGGHFALSVGAFGVSIAFLVLILLGYFFVLDLTPYRGWLYPASSLGLALAFVSLAATWEGHGWQKIGSVALALALPASLAIVPIAGVDPDPRGLTLLFAYNALFVVVAGSLLHILASSGEATQREILKASDSKISLLKEEIANKLKALEYKEKGYVDRETHLEAKEKNLLDVERDLDSRTKELNAVQAKLDAQGKALSELESRLGKMRAEAEAKVEQVGRKEKELVSVRQQIEGSRQDVAAREAALGEREKGLKRAQIDVTSRERAIEGRAAQLGDLEARQRREGEDLDRRRDQTIRKEKDLELKESEVKLKIEQLEAQQASGQKEKTAQLRDWEAKILAKERDLGKLEVKVRQLQGELSQQHQEADAYAGALAQEREALEGRERGLVAKEKAISDRDSGLDEKGAEIDRRWREVIETKKRLDERETEYNALFKDTKMREADFTTTKEEVTRRLATIDTREAKMKEWQANLGSETKRLQEKFRELLAREKAIEGKESDLSLKELEITTKERAAPRAAAGASGADQERHLEIWEKRLKEREEEFKRRMYQKEKELEAREMGVKEQLKAVAAPLGEVSEAPMEVAIDTGNKLRTGTPRLDDLLYGGLPMNSNVLYIGPAFVGKEVAILNFIAEGLRTNAPAIIVTTSKPPVEIAKEMAPVLPTFMEYEHLGLVRWIDASGTTPTSKLVRDGNTYHVPNAADFEGILAALNEAEEDFREKGSPYFRFAFLTLSSSLSQSEDKEALGFVQQFVNRLRQSKSVAAFALERGMHTDRQVEALQQLMDGAIHFRQDKAKTTLSVVGIGEVQTRDWVPYKFTNKALMVGSFQLERIR